MITSKSNSRVKQVRALRQHRERNTSRLFVAEGITHVGAAVESGAALEYILYAPDLLKSDFGLALARRAERQGLAVEAVTAEVFESLAEKDNPAGILAVVRQGDLTLDRLAVTPQSWYAALVAPQDPGNIGTILRTVDAVGASGLILLDGGADAFHPGAVRASLGAIFYHPVAVTDFESFMAWARRSGCMVAGSSARGAVDYASVPLQRPLVLVLGSEQKGLSTAQRDACDVLLGLPMNGRVTSLNLAVAAGVLLYALRARLGA